MYNQRVQEIVDPHREKLVQLLRTRLIEIGFKQDIKVLIQQHLDTTKGEQSIDGLVDEIVPLARSRIPTHIKTELMGVIRNVLEES
jgi:hypothetical protein